jgi:NitT/TauT family transport system substrate-binding protein
MNGSLRANRWLCILASVALLLGVSGCSREPETALRIGTNVWIGSEPLYLARELGHLDPAVVQLVEYPSASEVLRAYRNQAIDGMVISLDELFGLAVDGLQPRVILVVDISHGADVVVRPRDEDDATSTNRSQRGKRASPSYDRALTLNGMQASDVNMVPRVSGNQAAKGTVDGAVARYRASSQSRRHGYSTTRIPGSRRPLAVRATVIEAAKAVRLLAGWFKATDYMTVDPGCGATHGNTATAGGEQFSKPRRAPCSNPRGKSQDARWAETGISGIGRRLMT